MKSCDRLDLGHWLHILSPLIHGRLGWKCRVQRVVFLAEELLLFLERLDLYSI